MASLGPSVAASAVRAATKLVIAGCLVLMNLNAWGYITDQHFVRFAGIFNTWGLDYNYNKAVSAQSLDAYDTSFVALLWLPLLLMAYCAMLLLVVPHGAVPRAYKYARRQFTRMLAWEAPPRRFWTWWCGGMNGRDMVVLGFSIAFNLWYFIDYYKQYDDNLNAFVEAGVTLPEPRWRLMLERVALIFGIMMWPCIWLLFLPIPQSNFIQWLSGMTYTEMIRYHRWLGHVTMVVLSLHAWLYYLYWALKGAFWVNFTDWSETSTINYLAGSLSYIAGLVLWATSINWVRRRLYEVFYRAHVICFVLFTLFAYMHYFWSWSYFLPGLLLYAVDLVLRAGQLSNTTVVTGAAVDNEAGVATVQLKASRDACKCPVGELFMLVPSISRWQWHPISIAGMQADPEGKGSVITLSIKRYGKWTKDLLEKLQRPEPLQMRVAAPQGPNHDYWKGCKAIVLLGGGIGATPLLHMLRNMIAIRKANPKAELPERVHFVWASRQPREFCLLDSELLEAATSSGGWLTIELYSTRALPVKDAVPGSELDVGKASPRGSESDGDVKRMDSIVGKQDSGEVAAAMAGGAAKLDSPYFHKVPRVIQPQAVGFLHLSAVYLITWFAAFMGTVLGGVYVGEAALYFDVPGQSRNLKYLYSGTIWFFTQFVVTIGLPYLLCVLPMHSWRYWRASRQPGSDEVLELAPPAEPVGHGKTSKLVGGMITACGETGVEVLTGRPGLREAIQAVGAQYSSDDTVGVFVGGPEPMTRQVQLDAADLNGWVRRKGPYYQFRALAFFL